MSDSHEWCRDVQRDEAVRAAEDAAAVPAIQHRDLPEQVALLWASLGDIIGRVVRLEGEMDAGQDEEAAPAVCDSASPAEGLRTERVTLEITHGINSRPVELATWVRSAVSRKLHTGESVRVVEETKRGRLPDMVARLTAERDAALRERDAAKEECERLGHIVSKYQETRQWDIEKIEEGCVRICFGDHHRAADCEWEYFIPASREADFKNQRSGAIRERDEARAECERLRHLLNTKERECETHHPWVHPTEAAPPPRGWLTKEDCEALYLANAVLHGVFVGSWQEKHDAAKRLEAIRVRALSEASGEAAAPPRGWLTAEEREAVDAARDYFDDDCVFIVYTAERDAAIRERDAARAESERLRAAGDAMAESLTWDQSCAYDAATTRGAIRQRIKAWNEASARVAELEGAAAPAANAGGEDAVVVPQTVVAGNFAQIHWNTCCRLHRMAMDKAGVRWTQSTEPSRPESEEAGNAGGEQEPPRGWLTAEEREAVDAAADAIGDRIDAYKEQDGDRRRIEVLDALLARETPPRVRRPKRGYPPVPGGVVHLRDTEWIAAIRAAGGEVEE